MLDKDTLYQLYIDEQKTGGEIAAIAGVCSSTVYNWLDKYGIARRGRREAQRPIIPTKAVLTDLYIKEQLSIDQIQRRLNSSVSSISRLLDEYQIPKRERWARAAGWNAGLAMPKEQRQHLSEIAQQRTGEKSPRYGAVLSNETKQKISDSLKGRFRGTGNPQWKGGSSNERHKWQSRYEYKEWRAAVFERDKYICQKCGKPSVGNIEAHHICPWCDFPGLRFDIDNGITLCEECHLLVRHKELEYSKEFLSIIRQSIQ